MPKARLVGFKLTPGAVPVPLRATVCGLPLALSVTEILAVRAPVAVGLKVTLIVQFAPPARVAGLMGQVLVWAKSPGLVPLSEMLLMVSAAFPLLVSVTL